MVLSIKIAASSVWQEVCKKVKNAAVFVDEPAGECLSWHGGLHLLLTSGAISVKEFSSFESGENATKGVFIVSTPLTGPARIILRDLISNSHFEHCILITSCSPSVLTLATTGNVSETTEERTALHKLETDMLHWMKNKDYTVEIFHLLISCVPLSDNLFTFPPFRHVMPSLAEDLMGKTPHATLPTNLDLESLPLELQVGIVHIMTSLNSLLSKLSARESIYCMGMMSSLVGSQLQKHETSALRLKNAEHDVSLVLIDRTLDLVGPLMLNPPMEYTILDQMKAVLSPLPYHSVDVAIDMSPLCFADSEEVDGFTPVPPGCLHDPPSEWMDDFITRPIPEVVPHLYKRLAKALSINDIPKVITPKHLRDLITSKFPQKYEFLKKHLSVVEASLGVLQSVDPERTQSLKVVESLQKMIFQSISAENGTDEAVQHLIRTVYERRDLGLCVNSIFTVLVFVYSLVGRQYELNHNLEKSLKDAVLEMMTEEVLKTDHPSELVRKAQEGANVSGFVDRIFARLSALKNARGHLHQYADVASQKDPACPLVYQGVLYSLLMDITCPKPPSERPDIVDLKYKGNISLRNNFSSMFSKMLGPSKPHVMDNDVILVFVLGGLAGHEVKLIRNVFQYYGKRVIIGSTTLLSPDQILDNFFICDPLRPFRL